MATRQSTADYILGQIEKAGHVSARKMFGEYGIYCDGKLIALLSDDELFIKPSDAGRSLLGDVEERPPYPGAKPCFWISEETWDDAEWLTEVVKVTAKALPLPVKKPGKTG